MEGDNSNKKEVGLLERWQTSFFHEKGFLVLSPQQLLPFLSALREELGFLLQQRREQREEALEQTEGCILEPMSRQRGNASCRTDREAYMAERSCVCGPASASCSAVIARELLFGAYLGEVLSSPFGNTREVCLLNEQYIVKTENSGDASRFAYHQDRRYLDSGEGAKTLRTTERPYISAWIAMDDMDEENGCLYILPYPPPPSSLPTNPHLCFTSPEEYTRHHREMAARYPDEKELRRQEAEEIENGEEIEGEHALILPQGSLVLLSSMVWHRSGPNYSSQQRRAYMPQFSWGPQFTSSSADASSSTLSRIAQQNGSTSDGLVAFAVPLFEDTFP
ncbi:putative PhytanoylCoA dioxygenase domain containing 1 (Predicted) [Balamuthia mandrillaris]